MRKNKKNIRVNLYSLLEDPNYASYLDVDYEVSTNNCKCDDYCRCGVVSVKAKKFNKDLFIKSLISKVDDIDLKYGIDRLSNYANISGDNFPAYGVPDYYGETLRIEQIDSSHELFKLFDKYQGLNLDEKLKFLLTQEYGYILDVLKNKNHVSLQEISVSDLQLNNHYYKQVKSLERYKEYLLPRGVFIKEAGKFRLIDGNHRVMYAKNILNLDKIIGYVYE